MVGLMVSDAEYFAKVNPQRLTSMEEDSKKELAQYRKDELDRALRRSGKVKPEPQEITYGRFPEEA